MTCTGGRIAAFSEVDDQISVPRNVHRSVAAEIQVYTQRKDFMGAWGYAPWDSDSAADWYGDLFEEIPLAAKVEETLNSDPEANADEIRAAAALLIMLGRTYIWPIDDIDRHLNLAISQMEKVHAVYEDEPEFASAVEEEIAVLKSRQANSKDGPVLPQPESWGNFWS